MKVHAKTSSLATERSRTHARILDVATVLFAERGYGMTSMRDIARAARLRAATLYHYFPSKDDLYLEVLDREQARMRELMNEVLNEESEFPKQIEKMVARAFDYHLRNPMLAKLGIRAALGDGLRRPYDQRWLGMIEMLLRPRAAKGEIKDLDPALFLITAGAIITQHVIAVGVYRDLVGNRVSAEEAEARTREHVQQIFLRCLGLDQPPKE
ncbi:MAG: TetR/AcrR family transcriptional regulator [Candidatus Binatia bacterium]